MKVLFAYPNLAKSIQEPLGLSYVAGMLKHHGFETFLWDNTFEDVEALKQKVSTIKPELVCFSALSPDFKYAAELAKKVKSVDKETKTVIGGPHVTFLPYEALAQNCFDVVVRGEGEETLLEYAKTLNPKIKGAFVKDGDMIHTNPLRELPDVNKLPWPDHEMFLKHQKKAVTWGSVKEANYGVFITSRGCPFKCTYCSNKHMQKLYAGQRFTRYREINDVMNEVKDSIKRFNTKHLYFQDETLTTNKKRIIELCEVYKNEIGLPWHASTRADTVDEEVLQAMADSGCELVMMGVESGSERVRNEILGRNMKRETIINAFKAAKKAGIKTSAFNICGSPTETPEEIMETIKLNMECGADIGKMTIFTALPGTPLWDFCKENDYYIRERYPENYYIDSNVKHDTLSMEELQKFRKKFIEAMGGYSGAVKKGEI